MTRQSLAPEQRYAAVVVGILVLILFLVFALTWQAWRTALAQRSTVDTAIANMANFAAATYRSRLTGQLFTALTNAFRPVAALPAGNEPALGAMLAGIETAIQCRCGPSVHARNIFRVDLASGLLATNGQAPRDTAVNGLLGDTIRTHARKAYAEYSPPFVVLPLERGDSVQLLAYTVLRERNRLPRWALGFEIDLDSAGRDIFEPSYRVGSLLVALRADSMADSLYALSVQTPSGRTVFRTTMELHDGSVGRVGMPPYLGGLSLVVTLNPDPIASQFFPYSRASGMPVLVAILALTGALLGCAVVLIWRTTTLARLRADFTASVSHELRTPLAQIMLFAETMAHGRLHALDDYRREAGVILYEGRRLLHLVENVLHFARAERLSLPLKQISQRLGPILRATARDFAPLAAQSDMVIRLAIDEQLVAHVDAAAIRRALTNLLENALKYGPAGQEIIVGLTSERGCALIHVDDRGPGVPIEERRRIWKPFQRLTRDVELARAGSGIGLAIVLDIVRGHGGRVWVEDRPLGGSRFVLEFPAAWRTEGLEVGPSGSPEGIMPLGAYRR